MIASRSSGSCGITEISIDEISVILRYYENWIMDRKSFKKTVIISVFSAPIVRISKVVASMQEDLNILNFYLTVSKVTGIVRFNI